MIKLVVFLMAMLLAVPFSAQEQKIDSLRRIIATSKVDTVVSKSYKAVVDHYIAGDSILYQKYLNQGMAYARETGNRELELQLAFREGKRFYQKGMYEQVISTFDSLIPILASEELFLLRTTMMNYRGNAYASMSDYTSAVVSHIEFLEAAKKLPDNASSLAMANNNIGSAMLNMKRYEQAIEYLKESLAQQDRYKPNFKAHTYWNLGICYMELAQYEKALEVLKLGLEESIESGNLYTAAGNQLCIGSVYLRQDKYEKGLIAYQKAYDIGIDGKLEPYKLIEALNGLISGNNMLSRPEVAANYVRIADSITAVNKIPDIRNREFLFFKSVHLMQVGKPEEGHEYFVRYEEALDSLHNVENLEIIQTKETEFRTKEKEQQLEIKEAELASQRLLIALLGGGAFLLLFIGFLVYRQQRLKIKQQRQEQELKEALATVETKNKLEEQRLRISKELHDNIGSQLTYLASAAQNIGMGLHKTSEEVTQQKLDDLSTFSEEAIRDLRDTIWVMNHSSVTWDDLTERIRYLAHKVSNTTGIEVVIHKRDDNSSSLDPSQTMHVFRIIQEAISNAVKHSEAQKIEVFVFADNPAKIEIIDDGKGYDDTHITESSSGLNNMKSRADELQGELTLETNKTGTKVKLELPMQPF